MAETFSLLLAKPSRYDNQGYVVQWRRVLYPSNTLSTLNALAEDCAARRVLGEGVEIQIEVHDDQCGMPTVESIAARMRRAAAGCLACIVGSHSAHFTRAADLARRFRAAGVPVVMGGFHISGVLATLPEPPAELQEMLDIGVSLFVGEAEEGRFDALLQDAHAGRLRPIYDYLDQLVDLARTPPPSHLPEAVERRLALSFDPVDPVEAGRGCPFKCSFCTVINVHGRKPRSRCSEVIAEAVRSSVKRGRNRFMFTDDTFARNKNWREILEALARLREEEGLRFSLTFEVDTQSDRDPDFIPLAVRAGTVQVFIGLESINPDALAHVGKKHNQVDRYQRFFLEWKKHGVVTMAGYIIGFPNDTPETVRRDLKILQEQLPIDILYPFILTPLPGSADHAEQWQRGVPLDPDLSRYTTFHATAPHPSMSRAELESLYHEIWQRYYDDAHTRRIIHRHLSLGGDIEALLSFLVVARAAFAIEDIHPFEVGLLRIKVRTERRPDWPREAMIPFYLRRGLDFLHAQLRWGYQIARLLGVARSVRRECERNPGGQDLALAGLVKSADPRIMPG